MMYKVIVHFTDLQDNNWPYEAGDIYPRPGLSVTDARLAELSGSDNKRGIPLIASVEEAPKEAAPKKAATKRTKKTADK
jgi:hypothetical protein